MTRIVANSVSAAWKWGPLNPKWFIAKGTNRIVVEAEMGWDELRSFLNLHLSAAFSTTLELLSVEDKHDFCKAEAITRSIVVSIL